MNRIIISIFCFLLSYIGIAADRSYPVSEVNFGAYNTIYNLNITGYASGSALNIYTPNGAENEDWRINYISAGVYEIENSTTGLLITAGTNNVAQIATKANNTTQRWQFVGVTKDFLGEFLYYKIINTGNGKALTTSGTNVILADYSGANSQLWRLDLDGLEGFGAFCKVNEGIKASTIGGLLGETVFVSNLNDLRTALGRNVPLTVVLTANIDCINQGNDIRIDSYKTLIGSFTANTLTDARLVTNYYGWAYPPANPGPPSDNIVIKNLTFPVKAREDVIVLQVYSGKNVWIDHNTFYSTLNKNKDEVGKFVWINTSSDGPDKFRNPDFITLSYNVLRNRYWCVAYGTQNTTTTEDRTTVAFNIWDSNVRRTPQIGNGSMHTYNNFNVRNSSSTDLAGYANVIPGDGSFVYSEANRFENFKKESSGFWDEEFVLGSTPFKDVGSYTNKSESGSASVTPYLWSTTKTLPVLSWNPRTNYGYKVLKAYNSSGQNDAKAFNQLYSGSKSSQATFKYVTDADVNTFVVETILHPALISVVRDCNGVVDGTARFDNCGICTGGNTGIAACTGSIQGEEFCSSIGVQEATNTGFIGAGYVNFDNAIGSTGNYTIYSTSTGAATIGVRYANGGAVARSMSVSVNGTIQKTLTGAPTGSWTTWKPEFIILNLTSGVNIIQFSAISTDGGPNIDLLSFTNSNLSEGSCTKDCNGVFGGAAFNDQCNICVGGNTGKTACTQDCDGNWGGSAYEDNCGVCISTTNGNQECSGTMEAEEACSVDGILLEDRNTGFSGEGYVNADNAIGASATWILNSNSAQTATISFRYANGGTTSRDGNLSINGTSVGTVSLPATGAWTNWKMATVNVALINGSNEISLEATTADGLANIDLISFSDGVSMGQCVITGIHKNSGKQTINLYPNPTSNRIHWDNAQTWTLYNAQGTMIISGNGVEADLSRYPSGVYTIKFENHIVQIVKK